MSWGSAATTTADTGSAVSSTGGASGAMGGATGYTTTAADTIGTGSNVANTGVGPTVASANGMENAGSMTVPTQGEYNISRYGVEEPSFYDYAKDAYTKFGQGEKASFFDMMREGKFGNNPETYGYLNSLMKYGKQPQNTQAPTMVTKYQQPENPYLRKRGY